MFHNVGIVLLGSMASSISRPGAAIYSGRTERSGRDGRGGRDPLFIYSS